MKNSRIFKKQILRLQYLETEYEECLEIHDESKQEFEIAVRTLHYKLNIFDEDLDRPVVSLKPESIDYTNPPQAELSEEEIQKNKPVIPTWAKKLFRQVVKLTHPDKLSGNIDKDTQDRLSAAYQDTKEAMDAYDFVKIALIAQDLNINLKSVVVEDFVMFRKKEIELQEQIKKIKTSIFWIWSISTIEQKDQIIQEFLKSKGWTTSQSARKKSRKSKHPGQSIAWARGNSFKKEEKK